MSARTPIKDEVILSQIIFDDAIYPRKDHDPVLVQRYAQTLDEIEATQSFICVSSDNKLLDGKHRWLAYRKQYENDGDPRIPVLRYDVSAAHEQLKLACELNSQHGWQLTEEDKKRDAIALYNYGFTYENIAAALSIAKKTLTEWLSRTVKEQKDQRRQRILDLWLACHTQEEIAEAVGVTHQALTEEIATFASLVSGNQNCKTAANHLTDFEPPIYNIWKQQTKTLGSSHFGNSEVRWLDNLLYLYTDPFDVVIDPFAGGGSTIDICKKRFRRYFTSDRKPIVERETEIRRHDIRDGPLKPPQWKDVKLVYLDPPYWIQAKGQYSEDPEDLANQSLEDFTFNLSKVIKQYAAKINEAYIALIISPTQWCAPDKQYTDHVGDMLRIIKRPVEMRYSVPYESQQYTAQMVEWSKASKRCLVLTREIIVWRIE